MLNRRHIREKVLKTLYAFFQSGNTEIHIGEKELFHSIDKVYDVYLIYMSLLSEFRDAAETLIHERKQKHLPTAEDLPGASSCAAAAADDESEESDDGSEEDKGGEDATGGLLSPPSTTLG